MNISSGDRLENTGDELCLYKGKSGDLKGEVLSLEGVNDITCEE